MFRTMTVLILMLFTIVTPVTPALAHTGAVGTNDVTQPHLEQSDVTFYTRSVVLTRFMRVFRWSKRTRSESTAAIANALFQKATEQAEAGEFESAAATLAKYEKELDYLHTVMAAINLNADDVKLVTFLEGLAADQAAQLAILEATPVATGSSYSDRVVGLQGKVLRDITKILEKDWPADKQQEKVSKVAAKYAKHRDSLATKDSDAAEDVSESLAFTAKLDDDTQDDTLELALDVAEDVLVASAAKLDAANLGLVLQQLSGSTRTRSLIVLEKLLITVPEAARTGIETAIEAKVTQKAREIEADPTVLKELVENTGASANVKDKVLQRLMSKVGESAKPAVAAEQDKAKVEKEKARGKDNKPVTPNGN